jgi:hypothetical protein
VSTHNWCRDGMVNRIGHGDATAYRCSVKGCTIRTITFDTVAEWQPRRGANWRRGDVEVMPPCKRDVRHPKGDSSAP